MKLISCNRIILAIAWGGTSAIHLQKELGEIQKKAITKNTERARPNGHLQRCSQGPVDIDNGCTVCI